MPISATGNSIADPLMRATARRKRTSGFTLLEVLVVVTLVAIIGSAIALSIGARGDRELETVAERVRAAFNHAAEAAVTSGRAYGFFVTPEACEMVVYDGEAWQQAPAGSAGALIALSAPYALRGDGVYALTRREPPSPQMLLLPDGEQHYAGVAVVNTLSGEAYALEAVAAGRYDLVHRAVQ